MLEVTFATLTVVGIIAVIIYRVRRAEAERPYSFFLRSFLTVLTTTLVVGLGVILVMANPINWQTSWLSWPLLLSNVAIVVAVVFGCWYSIRAIWSRSKKNA